MVELAIGVFLSSSKSTIPRTVTTTSEIDTALVNKIIAPKSTTLEEASNFNFKFVKLFLDINSVPSDEALVITKNPFLSDSTENEDPSIVTEAPDTARSFSVITRPLTDTCENTCAPEKRSNNRAKFLNIIFFILPIFNNLRRRKVCYISCILN